MNARAVLYLSWRSFSRNLGRYRVLIFALALSVFAFFLIVGVLNGMTSGVYEKAGRYFAGDIAVQQFSPRSQSLLSDPAQVERVIEELPFEVAQLNRRSLYYDTDALVYFNGASAHQRRVIGVEWEAEAAGLSGMRFESGGVPEQPDAQAIVVSSEAAHSLGLRTGDEVVLMLSAGRGQTNTGRFIVAGVYAESSFFGYTCYVDRASLNELKNVDPGTVTEIGIVLADASETERAAAVLVDSLSRVSDTFPLFDSKAARDEAIRSGAAGHRYAVLTLGAQLAEIEDLVNALGWIASGVMALFVFLVMIGILNTYTMIVFERTEEIGTLRALGMYGHRIVWLFVLESVWLAVCGFAAGAVLGTAGLFSASRIFDFSGQAWADLFLVQGRVSWNLPAVDIALIAGVTAAACVLGSLRSSFAASRLPPAAAQRHT